MEIDFCARGKWLACNLLPHEPMLRVHLRRAQAYGLEIDDIIQEVYARIVSQPSLEAIRFPRQYAIQTANAIVIDHIRRLRVVPIHNGITLEDIEIASPEAPTDSVLEFRDEVLRIKKFLASLPPRTRDVLMLRRLEGLSQNETANRLGVSPKTVEKHLAIGVYELVRLFGRGGNFRTRSSKSGSESGNKKNGQTVGPRD